MPITIETDHLDPPDGGDELEAGEIAYDEISAAYHAMTEESRLALLAALQTRAAWSKLPDELRDAFAEVEEAITERTTIEAPEAA